VIPVEITQDWWGLFTMTDGNNEPHKEPHPVYITISSEARKIRALPVDPTHQPDRWPSILSGVLVAIRLPIVPRADDLQKWLESGPVQRLISQIVCGHAVTRSDDPAWPGRSIWSGVFNRDSLQAKQQLEQLVRTEVVKLGWARVYLAAAHLKNVDLPPTADASAIERKAWDLQADAHAESCHLYGLVPALTKMLADAS